jgi:uncharacterized UPF0146 family protein
MRNPTELMRSILTDPTAQEIIDYIPPVYGDSYVAIHIIQAIGKVLGEVRKICDDLMYETTPATSALLLDYWEDQYAIPRDSSLTIEQRRARIVQKRLARGPCNPAVLAAAVSSTLGGIRVDINERVAKNTFEVLLYEQVNDLSPAIAVLDRLKPAHLIYEIRIMAPTVITAEINVGAAVTYSEKFNVEVS